MTLKERLMADFKQAMKDKNEIRKNTINLARAAIKQIEIDTREEVSEDEIIAILTKQVKMRRDALADFEKGGRIDLLDAYKQEIKVLEEYLPEQMSYDDVKAIVETTANDLKIESGKENMGKLMGSVMPKVKGLADGNIVRKAVMEFLS